MTAAIVFICTLVAALVILAASSIRVLREYERAVVFRLGRLLGEKGPGLILLIPGVDRMVRIDLRTVTLDIQPQNLITRDNVPAKVTAVCYFRVIDAARAVVDVERYLDATAQIAQTTLRSVLGKAELDMLLSEREQLNEALQHIIDEHTAPVGDQGHHGRDQGRRDPDRDAARDGARRRRRARAAGEDHPRRG